MRLGCQVRKLLGFSALTIRYSPDAFGTPQPVPELQTPGVRVHGRSPLPANLASQTPALAEDVSIPGRGHFIDTAR